MKIFRRIIASAGFKIIKETKCMFSLTNQLQRILRKQVYNSEAVVKLDKILCRIFGWNTIYHTTFPLAKLRPTSIFYILKK